MTVYNKSRPTALAEMLNIELKFTVDCLKFWFNKNKKVLELSESLKDEFLKNNEPTNCCICDFPMKSRVSGGWFEHVCRAEHLFLENVYDNKDLYKMGVLDFDTFFEKVKKVLDKTDQFCESIEQENLDNINNNRDNTEIEELVKEIKKVKTVKNDTSDDCTKKKVIGYLYKHSINFLLNDKIAKDFPMSDKFLQNLYYIHTNKRAVHHSHVTGKIVGYEHEYCNLQVRENYYTIPIVAHNQFRFDFFLILKGIKASVWETTDINIGGRNTTHINFAIIRNQVRFIDTVKYFQQSLASLAASMTDIEKQNVKKNFKKILADRLLFCNEEQENWVLDYLTSGKGIIPYQMVTDFDSLNLTPEDGVFF